VKKMLPQKVGYNFVKILSVVAALNLAKMIDLVDTGVPNRGQGIRAGGLNVRDRET
jgi:hypothetical protein